MKNSKKGAKQDLIELLDPAIKDYFLKELKHSELTPVQVLENYKTNQFAVFRI